MRPWHPLLGDSHIEDGLYSTQKCPGWPSHHGCFFHGVGFQSNQLSGILNIPKRTWPPDCPSIPQSLPIIGYGWHTLPSTLNFSNPGAELPFPQLLFLILPRHFGYLTLSSTLLAQAPPLGLQLLFPPPPTFSHMTQGHVHLWTHLDVLPLTTINFLLHQS